jgi:hypothetical protein
MQAAHASVGPDPDIAVVVFQQRASTEICEPVAHLIVGNPLGTPAAHSFVGCNPDTSITALEKGPDKIVHQAFLSGVMCQAAAKQSKGALALGPNPKSAFAVAKDIAHTNASDSGKHIRRCLAVVDSKEIHCGYPEIAICILVDGFRV